MSSPILLHVDDDLLANKVMEKCLEVVESSVRLIHVSTGWEAIEFLRTRMEECAGENFMPEVIVVDVNMPWLNGMEFVNTCELLLGRGCFEHTKLVFCTSEWTPERIAGLKQLEIQLKVSCSSIQKPITPAKLEKLVGPDRKLNIIT